MAEVLPADIPQSLWAEFRRHRVRIKHPMTPYAEQLILAKLERFKADGSNPIDILNESIERGWAGVFLNGHSKKPETKAKIDKCCRCAGPLTTGWVNTRDGKKCHDC